MSQQGLMQASIRAVTGTTYTYEGDWLALFDVDGIDPGTFNERLLMWINDRLSTSYTEINGAMAAFALAEGADSFQAIGTFSATGNFDLLTPVLTWDGNTADLSPNYTIDLDPSAAVDDVLTFWTSETSDFTSYTEETYALVIGDLGGSASFSSADLTAGIYYVKVKHTRPSPAYASDWSNVVTVTIVTRAAFSGFTMILPGTAERTALGGFTMTHIGAA